MASYTEHYHLHQWTPEDAFLRTDFNTDLSAIDQALGELDSAVDLCGNCEVYTADYVGTDSYGAGNPNTLNFPAKPILITISGSDMLGFASRKFEQMTCIRSGGSTSCSVTWSDDEKTLSWYSTDGIENQLNSSRKIYHVTMWSFK